ncbi:MAG: hypothetical protein ABI560_08115 [Myxococcales bacterium]
MSSSEKPPGSPTEPTAAAPAAAATPRPALATTGGAPPAPPQVSRLGHFITTYSSFLSSFVIGVAGLVATSIWQYRQSQTATRQAESEQTIARTKADNDWRIARAEILAKNLNILASQAPDSADQRFGVLLSLTRGSILDPELAVSYALELGKVNPDYMRTVLSSTSEKNYLQLEHAFLLTCVQRFGVERDAPICKNDKLADRSDGIAQVVQDELGAAAALAKGPQGPLLLLRDERNVQEKPGKLLWLFEPYLQDLYERRQWNEITAFESSSVGARLVAALVLATARTGELVTNAEQSELVKFHAERRKWLVSYMFGRTCDTECRGKLLDVMLSTYGEAQGDYDESLKKLLQAPRSDSGPAMARLHARLLWCQVDSDDLQEFRDRVLVPSLMAALSNPATDRAKAEELIGLVSMVPEPGDPRARQIGAPPSGAGKAAGGGPTAATETPSITAWKAMLATIERSDERLARAFSVRRATVKRERANPPPMIKQVDFCSAGEVRDRIPSGASEP